MTCHHRAAGQTIDYLLAMCRAAFGVIVPATDRELDFPVLLLADHQRRRHIQPLFNLGRPLFSGDQLLPAAKSQRPQHSRDVQLRGSRRDLERLGDGLVRLSSRKQAINLLLSRSENDIRKAHRLPQTGACLPGRELVECRGHSTLTRANGAHGGDVMLCAECFVDKPSKLANRALKLGDRLRDELSCEAVNRLGVAIVNILFSEVVNAIQTGVIDGADAASMDLNLDLGIHSASKHSVFARHSMPTTEVSVSLRRWRALSPANQELLVTSVAKFSELQRSVLVFPSTISSLRRSFRD